MMGKARQLTDIEASIVKQLRKDDLSYCAIERQTGIHHQSVAHYCHENGLARWVHPNVIAANQRTAAKRVAKSIERYSGFVCVYCGEEYILNRNRWGAGDGMLFCSQECFHLYRTENRDGEWSFRRVYFPVCVVCGKRFTSRRDREHCSRECELEHGRRRAKEQFISVRETNPLILNFCKECGEPFVLNYYAGTRLFCFEKCEKRSGRRIQRSRRKARKRDAFIEDIDLKVLYFRDGGECQVCGEELDLQCEVPHPLAPTVDHFIPLSKGGKHEYANAQLACFTCNWRKGDRIIVSGEHLEMLDGIV